MIDICKTEQTPFCLVMRMMRIAVQERSEKQTRERQDNIERGQEVRTRVSVASERSQSIISSPEWTVACRSFQPAHPVPPLSFASGLDC